MDLKRQHEFIVDLWQFIKSHQDLSTEQFCEVTMRFAEQLHQKYKDIPYAFDMILAYTKMIDYKEAQN